MLLQNFAHFSTFSFGESDKLFAELTGQNFRAALEKHLQGLREDNRPLEVALDLSVLPQKFLRSQELGRQIDRVVMEGRKHPEKKVDFVIVGSEFFRELNGMTTITCERFPLIDFEQKPPVGF